MQPAHRYITASKTRVLYIGCTSRHKQRVWRHKVDLLRAFSDRYGCHCLVFMAEFADIPGAIAWERSWKGKSRAKKLALAESLNPAWKDLALAWFRDAHIDDASREIREGRKRG